MSQTSCHFFYQRYPMLTLLLLSVALTSIGILERDGGVMSLLWLTNAVLIGVLLRFYRHAHWRHFLVCGCGMMLVDLMSGTSWHQALSVHSVNVISIWLGYAVLRRYAWRSAQWEWLQTPFSIPQLLLLCQPALLSGALLGGWAVHNISGAPYWKAMTVWYLDELLNFSVLLPAILTIPVFKKLSWRVLARKSVYLLPSLLLLCLLSVVDKHLAIPLTLLLTVPTLLWLALSGNLFLTTLSVSMNGVYFFIWIIDAVHQHLKIVDDISISIIRACVAILALCGVTIAAAISERDRLFGRLCEMASSDYLTGILNRRAFTEEAEKILENSNCDKALVLIDVDFFKKINDQWGHLKGDQVLIALCRRLEKHLPEQRLFGRIGGEEFALLLCGMNQKSYREMANNIVNEMGNHPLEIDDCQFPVTISAGLVQNAPGQKLEVLLNRADQALYQAKNSGRNRLCEYF